MERRRCDAIRCDTTRVGIQQNHWAAKPLWEATEWLSGRAAGMEHHGKITDAQTRN